MTCWLWCIWQDNLQYIFITHKQLSEMAFFGHKCSIQIHKIQLDFTTEDFSKTLGSLMTDWLRGKGVGEGMRDNSAKIYANKTHIERHINDSPFLKKYKILVWGIPFEPQPSLYEWKKGAQPLRR